MIFANPTYLFLLILLIPLIGWYVWKQRNTFATLQVSTTQPFEKMKPTWRIYARHLPFVFRVLVFALLIIVLARPQSTDNWENVST
ncbi:MAG: BatA domain-containing protein, partial [Bacteroidales bacterium]